MKSRGCPIGCEAGSTEDECERRRAYGIACCSCVCHVPVGDQPDPVRGYPTIPGPKPAREKIPPPGDR